MNLPLNNEVVIISETSPSGNCFCIMATAQRIMTRNGCPSSLVKEYLQDAMSSDYEHLKNTTKKYINVKFVP